MITGKNESKAVTNQIKPANYVSNHHNHTKYHLLIILMMTSAILNKSIVGIILFNHSSVEVNLINTKLIS